jgi:hypothetical protein
MKKKYLFLGAGILGAGFIYYCLKNKTFMNNKTESSASNEDKITATSLSDAQNKESVNTAT